MYGDAYCPQIAQLVRASVRKVATNAPGLLRRDEAAIAAVAEGLILSGVAMAFAGNSRPASGLEHYFSHVWEDARAPARRHVRPARHSGGAWACA